MPSTIPELIRDAGQVESRITPEAVQRRVQHRRRARGALALLTVILGLVVAAPIVRDDDDSVSVATGGEDAGSFGGAAAPPALGMVTARAASPEEAAGMATGRYAYIQAGALVIADAHGQVASSIDLPPPTPGHNQRLVGVTERALVSNGNVALIVDLSSGAVRSVGPISGGGMVLDPAGGGFWAAEQGFDYTLRDWEGRPVGEKVTLPRVSIPFAARDNTLLALVMNNGTVISADKDGVTVVGSGMPLAADRSNISFQTEEGDIKVIAGGTVRTVASVWSLRPAQTIGAASFSPDGQWLGVVVMLQNSGGINRGGTTGVVLIDLRNGRPPLLIATPFAHGLAWRDDGRVILVGEGRSMVLDVDTHLLLEIPPPVGQAVPLR